MEYYPIFVRVCGRPCLVIGGGQVATQKVTALIAAGARVTVISPTLTARLQGLADRQEIEHRARSYRPLDVKGFFLAFAATADDAVDRRIDEDAAATGVLLNVVDRSELCDFIAPAIVERGDLVVAVSTSGRSPAMAKRLRRKLEEDLGDEYALALQLLGRLRRRLRSAETPAHERARIFNTLVDSPLLDLLRQRRFEEIDALLAAAVGGDVSLRSLDIDWSQAR